MVAVSTTANNQQGFNDYNIWGISNVDSADYDDVPSSNMLGQIFEGVISCRKDNKVELGMAAEEPTVSADGACLYI